MKRLVVVGNGMAGMACVEQILKYQPRFRDHRLRRRDARQLQPHPAVVGAGRREGRRRHRPQPLDWYQRHGIDLRVGVRIVDVDADAKTVTGDDGSVTPYDKLLLATGSTRVDAADRRARQGRRLRLPHARRHARAAAASRVPASRPSSSAAACSVSKRRAACRCRAAT